MAIKFNFFIVPSHFLEPHSDPSFQPFADRMASCEFHKAVVAIADKYNIDYLKARNCAIEIHRSQSTFNLYDICCCIFEGEGWPASRFVNMLAGGSE